MAVGVQLPKLDVQAEVKFLYREAVDSLFFAAMEHDPTSRTHCPSCQHLCAFGEEYIAVVKRIMRYLQGTIDVTLKYGTNGRVDMIGYVNADHIGNHATRRSMTGYIFTLNGMVVTWASQLQGVVALSTCEAEYVTMAEALWLRTFFRELYFERNRCSSVATIKKR